MSAAAAIVVVGAVVAALQVAVMVQAHRLMRKVRELQDRATQLEQPHGHVPTDVRHPPPQPAPPHPRPPSTQASVE